MKSIIQLLMEVGIEEYQNKYTIYRENDDGEIVYLNYNSAWKFKFPYTTKDIELSGIFDTREDAEKFLLKVKGDDRNFKINKLKNIKG